MAPTPTSLFTTHKEEEPTWSLGKMPGDFQFGENFSLHTVHEEWLFRLHFKGEPSKAQGFCPKSSGKEGVK